MELEVCSEGEEQCRVRRAAHRCHGRVCYMRAAMQGECGWCTRYHMYQSEGTRAQAGSDNGSSLLVLPSTSRRARRQGLRVLPEVLVFE